MSKKVLFISHAQIDTLFAKEIKSTIEEHFRGAFDIFVSSDENSINLGDDWIEKIFDSLDKATCMLSLCSPASISRPWIPFEMGYIQAKRVPCIPICIRGLKISNLPAPLSYKQGIKLEKLSDFNALVERMAKIFSLIYKPLTYDSIIKYSELANYTPDLVSTQDEYEIVCNLITHSLISTEDACIACFNKDYDKHRTICMENAFFAFEGSLNIFYVISATGKNKDKFHVFYEELKHLIGRCKIAISLTNDMRLKRVLSGIINSDSVLEKGFPIIDVFYSMYSDKIRNKDTQNEILEHFRKVKNNEIKDGVYVENGFFFIFITLYTFKNLCDELKNLFFEKNIIL